MGREMEPNANYTMIGSSLLLTPSSQSDSRQQCEILSSHALIIVKSGKLRVLANALLNGIPAGFFSSSFGRFQ